MGLNTMMGRKPKSQDHCLPDSPSVLNDLNQFYGRFDTPDFKAECDIICASTPRNPTIQLKEQEVGLCLSQTKPRKAPGPDGLCGHVLKVCSTQLRAVLTRLFQRLLYTCTVPRSWNVSTIRPVPKKPGPTDLNNFCPVALTPVMAKCMERVDSKHLTSYIAEQLDPL